VKFKDEAFDHFKIYKAEAENQLDRKIKRLRTDRGGEYFPMMLIILMWSLVLSLIRHLTTHLNQMGWH
jgi:hypothetical protein